MGVKNLAKHLENSKIAFYFVFGKSKNDCSAPLSAQWPEKTIRLLR